MVSQEELDSQAANAIRRAEVDAEQAETAALEVERIDAAEVRADVAESELSAGTPL